MALNIQILKDGLLNLQNNPPNSLSDAASKWASLYHSYAIGAQAGGVMLPTGLNKAVIESQLLSVQDGNFFSIFGKAITLYWQPILWSSPGFTGVVSSAIGADQNLIIASNKVKNLTSKELSSIELANAIHSHALTISVVMTNVSSGVTAIVTLL